jgi:SAM-dependent methyltransferase
LGETDWDLIWKEKFDNASWSRRPRSTDGNELRNLIVAEQYHRDALWREQTNHQVAAIAGRIKLDRDTTVLDIGAGTGVLTVVLSRMVKRVTAIEPSPAMFTVFQHHLKDTQRANVRCINTNWESIVHVEPHDVVLASFSLAMRDIKTSLLKMARLANKAVCLFTFAGNPVWDYTVLWPMFFGEPYDVGPDYMDLANVLYHMGVHANIEILPTNHGHTFESFEQALAFWKANLNIDTDEDEIKLTAYLKKRLTEKDGQFHCLNSLHTAMIWWRKAPASGHPDIGGQFRADKGSRLLFDESNSRV